MTLNDLLGVRDALRLLGRALNDVQVDFAALLDRCGALDPEAVQERISEVQVAAAERSTADTIVARVRAKCDEAFIEAVASE